MLERYVDLRRKVGGICGIGIGELYRKKSFQRHLHAGDVFIVGHPKSGNTWLTYMLAIVVYKDGQHQITLANIANYIPFIHGNDRAIANYSSLPEPRIFRNEWPVYPDLYPKTIYLVRDPRAVLVSYYHHYRAVTANRQKTIQAFIEEYLETGFIRDFDTHSTRWDKQVLEWTKRAKRDERVMIVKYEDMANDREGVLRRVVRFVGVPCAEENIVSAAARGSFKAMRADEEQHGAESYPGEIGQRGRFIRRGKVDGWREEMPPDLAKRIENEFAEAMNEAGYL